MQTLPVEITRKILWEHLDTLEDLSSAYLTSRHFHALTASDLQCLDALGPLHSLNFRHQRGTLHVDTSFLEACKAGEIAEVIWLYENCKVSYASMNTGKLMAEEGRHDAVVLWLNRNAGLYFGRITDAIALGFFDVPIFVDRDNCFV
jgi:hypothetical protein